ncbi:MAG: CBS domain-containing protein [Spirochaetales bacterium]|nr:CBS domain-containing protein [Spirochaetales bacterium]
MKILVGHANMDLDCFGSLALARYLYPRYIPVKSRLIHPMAKPLYALYQDHLSFMPSRELKGEQVEKMVVFDTRNAAKIREYMDYIKPFKAEVEVYDHHVHNECDIPGAVLHEAPYGSNTTLVAEALMSRDITIPHDAATIALTGIFSDTGSFTHENVHPRDFEAARWLLHQGASIKMVKQFLKVWHRDMQIDIFHKILNSVSFRNVHGYSILFCHIYLDDQVGGLSDVVQKVFDVENADAIFAVFSFQKRKRTLIIGRSRHDSIDLSQLLKNWGGGGHPKAASATIKELVERDFTNTLRRYLREVLVPACNVSDIMTRDVKVITDSFSVLESSLFLEQIDHTGVPVVDEKECLVGFISLRDISKARVAGQMKASVRGYMTHKLYTVPPDASLRDLERMFLDYNVGHVPVVSDNRVMGIVTRSDYLKHI